MAIKKLQNDFTTPEQSKRLLELGVPADSANCFYSYYRKTYAHSEYTEILWHRPRFITEDNKPDWTATLLDGTHTHLPCWSVGRLMEIMALCYKFDFTDSGSVQLYATDIKNGIVVDVLISDIERFINKIDFSKLED